MASRSATCCCKTHSLAKCDYSSMEAARPVEMPLDPPVPIGSRRNLQIPEHVEAARRQRGVRQLHTGAIAARIGEENISQATPGFVPPHT